MRLGEQQDASYVGVVVVEGVQLRRGHVEGPRCWEAVVQLLVEGQQVHVVHRHVVRVIGALQEAHVDQGRPVEPGGGEGEREGEREREGGGEGEREGEGGGREGERDRGERREKMTDRPKERKTMDR